MATQPSTEIIEVGAEAVRQGKVYKKAQGYYFVHAGGGDVLCTISSKLRKDLVFSADNPTARRSRVIGVDQIRKLDPVAIGDDVNFTATAGERGVIQGVLPRRTKLSRRATGNKPIEQVIVANVDQVVAVFAAAQPAPSWGLLDRYLASAEAAELPPIICITKLDLAEDECFMEELRVYEKLGYRVVLTSAQMDFGVDQLKAVLKGKVSVLLGKSGVGKTTLLNTMQPGLGLRVSEVSAKSGRGRHTTTNLELFELKFGGAIVDTPGMREFGLWGGEDELDVTDLFPEIRPLVGQCKFGQGCAHVHEPGCAIKDAVERGEVNARRYDSFLRMREESE